jgi:hypothetical protein
MKAFFSEQCAKILKEKNFDFCNWNEYDIIICAPLCTMGRNNSNNKNLQIIGLSEKMHASLAPSIHFFGSRKPCRFFKNLHQSK